MRDLSLVFFVPDLCRMKREEINRFGNCSRIMNNINSILFVRNGETSDWETLVGHSLITYSYVEPTHFMRGTAAENWGTDTHEVMRTTAADWDTEDMTTAAADCWDLDN